MECKIKLIVKRIAYDYINFWIIIGSSFVHAKKKGYARILLAEFNFLSIVNENGEKTH